MRSMFKGLILLVLLVLPAVNIQAESPKAPMSEGEYLARAGNCVACHTIEGGKPFAGGLEMAVPGLGSIYSTNITPDEKTGIGLYSFEEFDRSMRLGIAKDGHRLYPAMPYPSYAKITEQDMRALYNYFMHEVAPVDKPNLDSTIRKPLRMRWPLAIWNTLFLNGERYQSKPEQSDAWNRGAYLVQGLGHCGACHTPRGLFMQEASYDERGSKFLSGAVLDHWSASSLNGDVNSGLGRWSADELAEYLATGKNRHGTAFGTMVEVINNSTQYLTEDDQKAMAVYLKSLPPYREKQTTPFSYDDSTERQLMAVNLNQVGAHEYYQECLWCHGYDGKGQAKFQPSLAGNSAVLDPAPDSLINLILNGSLRVVANGNPEPYDMPHLRDVLSDQQIADVLTFIRRSWGNRAGKVAPEQVAEVRRNTDPTLHDIIVLQMK